MLKDLRAGGKPGLARALAEIERRPESESTLALLDTAWAQGRGVAIGLTGPPGVGKSTLIDALIRAARAVGRRVGVIAIDPSSRRTQGALLGDRARISADPEDDGVFVRSMAARDRLGGLAALAFPAATLMRAVCDLVIIETVGVGQSETDVAGIADIAVFCAQPAAGDSLQFMKAGVMEVPDLVLVTKADLGEPARRAAADAAGALSLAAADGPTPPVRLISALNGDGIAEAMIEIEALAHTKSSPERAANQAATWVEDGVRTRFGVFGLEAARSLDLLTAANRPFHRQAAVMAALETAFTAGLTGAGLQEHQY
ncbi:MAG: ATP/GTP-binding protein [Rhodobacteraceae bacterium]|nr:ATP/GTP-binding protein [Paracoccaceae bacterium]